jgi:hypothetical protein
MAALLLMNAKTRKTPDQVAPVGFPFLQEATSSQRQN